MSDEQREQQVRMRAELLASLDKIVNMHEEMVRIETLKLATRIELAVFDNRDDKRDRDRLNGDIQITAGKLIGFVRTGQPQ